ncbi:intracellular protein transport protein USO1-like isoform X2 [Rhododendron vialii]|uniref:intracellular protein transport protein USO1-like isoform X2 n=1 Tax=Rhododendron vialii TaxID=182163 RepID=UPI00265DFD89|nr:intracellular protein transport protein USO1-like isoform X2 [Rhododendron vialii]
MQAMIRLMKVFPVTPALKDSLKKTPFWHLINAFIEEKVKSEHCRKFDEVVVKIVELYDANTRTFTLGNKHVKLEREDVKLIFGISCGNEEINQGYCKKEDVQLAVKWKIKQKRLDTSIIKKLLKEKQNNKLEEDMDDVARLLCLFLCGTLFFSTSGTTINWVYVCYMEDLNTIKQFDWPKAICKYLLKSTHAEHKDPKEVKGSSILLLYWLCAHSNILNQESLDSIPRLLEWNIAKLRKELKDVRQLQQLPDEKVKDGTLEQTIEEKVDYEFEQHEVQQDPVQLVAGEKDDGEKVEVAEVENVPNSCGLDDFDTPTDMFQSPLCLGEIDESQAVSFRRDEVTSPKYNSDSTLEPNTLSRKSLLEEEDECLNKLVDNILDDSKKYAAAMVDELTEERHSISDNLTDKIEYLEKQMEIEKQSNKDALAMIDELRKEKDSITNDMSTNIECLENEKKKMEIEKESICEPLNDEIAKLKKLVESQDKQIIMLKDVMSKGPLTSMHELKNQKQSLEKDLIEKVESLEKEKKQLELQKLKMQEDNDIVLQSKDQQITELARALARKIEETGEEMKNQIQSLDKQNKKLCLAKDRYIQTLLNKASVLEKQKAKQQDVNNVLQMQI